MLFATSTGIAFGGALGRVCEGREVFAEAICWFEAGTKNNSRAVNRSVAGC
jgi:hypothetical protein